MFLLYLVQLNVYNKYYNSNDQKLNLLNLYLIKKSVRSQSGVLVSTLVLRPDVFSCPKKCSYCPTETDIAGNLTQPKSYLSNEPAMMRALVYNFDIKGQFSDRIRTYIGQGNLIDSNDSYKKVIFIYFYNQIYKLFIADQLSNI